MAEGEGTGRVFSLHVAHVSVTVHDHVSASHGYVTARRDSGLKLRDSDYFSDVVSTDVACCVADDCCNVCPVSAVPSLCTVCPVSAMSFYPVCRLVSWLALCTLSRD